MHLCRHGERHFLVEVLGFASADARFRFPFEMASVVSRLTNREMNIGLLKNGEGRRKIEPAGLSSRCFLNSLSDEFCNYTKLFTKKGTSDGLVRVIATVIYMKPCMPDF